MDICGFMCIFSYLRWLITGLVNLFFTLSPHRFWGQAKRIVMPRKVILASIQLKTVHIDRGALETTLQLAVWLLNVFQIPNEFSNMQGRERWKQTWKGEIWFPPTLKRGLGGLLPRLSGEAVQQVQQNVAWISASSLAKRHKVKTCKTRSLLKKHPSAILSPCW